MGIQEIQNRTRLLVSALDGYLHVSQLFVLILRIEGIFRSKHAICKLRTCQVLLGVMVSEHHHVRHAVNVQRIGQTFPHLFCRRSGNDVARKYDKVRLLRTDNAADSRKCLFRLRMSLRCARVQMSICELYDTEASSS